MLFTFFERSFAHIFFSHAVLREIMKIYRTSCRSKMKEFAFGELALYSFPDSPSLNIVFNGGLKTLQIRA